VSVVLLSRPIHNNARPTALVASARRGAVFEMSVNDAQRHFFELFDNGIEQCLCRLMPFIDASGDISPLDYERVVIWESSRNRSGWKVRCQN
jgi:hypothetical protein